MTIVSQLELNEQFQQPRHSSLTNIIDTLAGKESSLRVHFHQIRFDLGDKHYEIGGQVNVNILRNEKQNAGLGPLNGSGDRDHEDLGFEPGKVLVYTGDQQVLNVNVTGKQIDLDVRDKQFVKRLIRLRTDLFPKQPETPDRKGKKKSNPLEMIRLIAETAKELGITVTISYKGRRIATMGADAHPTFSHLVTKTRALAVNDVLTAIEMMI
jgi:hypothetical protein